MDRPFVLVVDKDPVLRATLGAALEASEAVVLGASTLTEITGALRDQDADVLIVDSLTPGVDSGAVLRQALRSQRPPIVAVVAPAGSEGAAAEMLEAGAFDFVTKPLDVPRARRFVRRIMRHHGLREEARRLRERLRTREGYWGIVGHSAAMDRVRGRLQELARSNAPVWFRGESGTGKELAARTLHAMREDGGSGRFVVVRCGERPELERAIERAAGGTLYLDRLTALEFGLQGRVLERLTPPAGGAPERARVCCSAETDPRTAVEQGRLLDRLGAALSAETVELPPLRERREDIALLARYFIESICTINRLPPIELSTEAAELLEGYRWPENVHELRNAMEHAVILTPDGTVRPRDLPERLRESVAVPRGATGIDSSRQFREAKKDVVERFERAYLTDLMESHGGNVTAAAQEAGMLRSALQRLLRKHGLKSAEFRRARRPRTPAESPRSERSEL